MSKKPTMLYPWIGDIQGLLWEVNGFIFDKYRGTTSYDEVNEHSADWRWRGDVARVLGSGGWFEESHTLEAQQDMTDTARSYGCDWRLEQTPEGDGVLTFFVHPEAKSRKPMSAAGLQLVMEALEERRQEKIIKKLRRAPPDKIIVEERAEAPLAGRKPSRNPR